MKRYSVIFVILFLTAISVCSVNAQDKYEPNEPETKSNKQEYDQNIKIKKKPRVETARFCSQLTGTARLKVTFDKSAKVTNVEIISPSGCESFDENAVRAAKKIKFKPAIKNGEPVTVTKFVEYVFTLYIDDKK